MARPRGFQADKVVEAAMMLFWRHGYDSVSFADLVEATGASRKGLYALWPDKQALFVDALQLYGRRVSDYFFTGMETREAGLPSIATFIDRFEEAARAPGWRGCLVMRTLVAEIAAEPPVGAKVDAYCDRLSASLEHAFAGAAKRGELAPGIDPIGASRQIFAVAVACSVLGVGEGFTPRISSLLAAARAACGLKAHIRRPAAAKRRER